MNKNTTTQFQVPHVLNRFQLFQKLLIWKAIDKNNNSSSINAISMFFLYWKVNMAREEEENGIICIHDKQNPKCISPKGKGIFIMTITCTKKVLLVLCHHLYIKIIIAQQFFPYCDGPTCHGHHMVIHMLLKVWGCWRTNNLVPLHILLLRWSCPLTTIDVRKQVTWLYWISINHPTLPKSNQHLTRISVKI